MGFMLQSEKIRSPYAWAYLKSYSFLMFLTFGELFAGLWLLHIPCAGWIALGIAAFDILPIVGTGGILLPWAGIAGFMGDYSLAAGLLILYGVITIVRNIWKISGARNTHWQVMKKSIRQ